MSKFKEWLAEEAKQEQSQAATRAAEIANWKAQVSDLFRQIETWLQEEGATEYLQLVRSARPVAEDGLGRYDAPVLRIEFGQRRVLLAAVARNTIAPRALGILPALGRVDMTGGEGARHYMLFLVGSGWDIMDDESYRPVPLDRETFTRALRDLLS